MMEQKIDALIERINAMLVMNREMALAMTAIAKNQDTAGIMARDVVARAEAEARSLRDYYAKEFMLRRLDQVKDVMPAFSKDEVLSVAQQAYAFADAVMEVRTGVSVPPGSSVQKA